MGRDDKHNRQEHRSEPGGKTARRRWPWLLAAVLLCGGILLWFAPALAARAPILSSLLSMAAPQLDGRVSVGSASLGWLSPVVLHDVAVRDEQAEPLLEAAALRSEKSLLSLLRDRRRLGLLRAEQPRLHWVLRRDGSNLEDTIRALSSGAEFQTGGLQCQIVVNGGEIEVVDSVYAGAWSVQEVEGSFALQQDPSEPLQLQLQGCIYESGSDAGRVKLEVVSQAGESPAAAHSGGWSIAVQCESFPLQIFNPVLRRFSTDVRFGGRCSGGCRYAWSNDGSTQSLRLDRVAAESLSVVTPQWLKTDRPQISRLAISGQIERKGDRVQFDRVTLASELATLAANGGVTLPAATNRPLPTSVFQAIQQEDCELKGEIDLAMLAEMLPATLGVREAARVNSGSVSLSLSSRRDADHRRWRGRVETTKLSAVHEGRRVEWEEPIQVEFAGRWSPAGMVVEQLACESSFFHVSGHGDLASGQLHAQADLDRLVDDLGRVLNLAGLQLAGSLQAALQWRQPSEGRLEAGADISLRDFRLQASSLRPWREDQLTISAVAEGDVHENRLRGIRKAVVRMCSGTDRLDLALREPVAAVWADAAWPLQCTAKGDLPAWLARLQPLFLSSGWETEGTIDLTAKADVAPNRIAVESAACAFESLRLKGRGVSINDPRVVVETSASWDPARRQLDVPSLTLASSTLAFRANSVTFRSDPRNPQLVGGFAFRADLAKLTSWLRNSGSPPVQQLFGMATGNLRLDHEEGLTRADWSAELQDVVYARLPKQPASSGVARLTAGTGGDEGPWRPVWREERLSLSGRGGFEHARGKLTLAMLDADTTSKSLRLKLQGEITDLTARPCANLEGQVEYDLQGVFERLRPLVGGNLQVAGRATRPFYIRGPLPASTEASEREPITDRGRREEGASIAWAGSKELTAAASVGWTSASFQGIAMGPGELHAKLAGKVLAFDPLDLQFSDGRLALTPQIRFGPTPACLLLKPGPLFERVRLSPEMCRGWIKYVAPLLADATQAEGRFSLTLSDAAIPLATPQSGRVRGVMIVHQAQVGPGPLSREFLWIAQQVRAIVERRPFDPQLGATSSQWLTLPAQNVGFEMADGRVHHQNFELNVGDVVIRTHGSVGLDESLALVAEVPIRNEWVKSQPVFASLKGQIVRIAIKGKLSRPEIDRAVLRQLASQVLGGAATRLLEDELNRGLQRLFGP